MRKHIPFIIFFSCLLIIGICIHGDYGISWDESDCRIDIGILNTNFIKSHNEQPLLESIAKYHGSAFEIFLFGSEELLGLNSIRSIFLMRHLLTFLLFAFSVLIFYRLLLKQFESPWYSLAGCVMLVLSPRIFADSFYNSKDLPFLSLFIISTYSINNFIRNKSIGNAVLSAIACGLMIDIRMMGLLLPAFVLLVLFINFLNRRTERKKIFLSTSAYVVVLCAIIIACWPVLWLDPIYHFKQAFVEMSKYPWNGAILYQGQNVISTELPWHYIPVWILISTPPLYIALFFIGLAILLRRLFISGASTIEWISLYTISIPYLTIILLNSVVYDGWRHLFFIYPSIIIVAIGGLKILMDVINEKYRKYLIASVTAYYSSVIITMAALHPFENVYFNTFTMTDNVNEKYETDYWALSYKQAYEYILKNDTSQNIVVMVAQTGPGIENLNFLPEDSKERISITGHMPYADYYLTAHRYDKKLDQRPKGYQIKRNGITVHSIYDIRNEKFQLKDENLIAEYFTDYSTVSENFNPNKIIEEKENKCELVKAENPFAGNFYFQPSAEMIKDVGSKKAIVVKCKIKSDKPFKATMIFQVDSTKTYSWIPEMLSYANGESWNTSTFMREFPPVLDTAHRIRIHIINSESKEFLIDDFRISIYK